MLVSRILALYKSVRMAGFCYVPARSGLPKFINESVMRMRISITNHLENGLEMF